MLDYIEEHLKQDLGLAELAALIGLSTRHFGQAFKTSTGLSPHRYVIERRIHRAKELLLGGDLSVAQIAADVGFSNRSHLVVREKAAAGRQAGMAKQ